MRKLFRMQFEGCLGECYSHSDVMRIHVLGLDVEGTAAFLRRLLAMHAPACGDDRIGFRLDVDEVTFEHPTFVASLQRPGALDLFLGATPLEALDRLIDGALAYYATDEFKNLAAASVGRDACRHGSDEKLVAFALAFSGLGREEQEAVRALVT